MAEVVFKRDLEVIMHTNCQRVAAYNLRMGRDDEAVTNDEVLSQTEQTWQNND